MAKKIKLFRSITNITSGQLLSSVVFQQRGFLEVDSKRKKLNVGSIPALLKNVQMVVCCKFLNS